MLLDLRDRASSVPEPTEGVEVWSLEMTGVERPSSTPPLFWAVARGARLCEIRLLVARTTGRSVVATSVVSLAPGALSYSQRTVFRRASEPVLRRVRSLGSGSAPDEGSSHHPASVVSHRPASVVRSRAEAEPVPPVDSRGSATAAVVRLVALRLSRFVTNVLRARAGYRFQWLLGVRRAGVPGSTAGFVPCLPPLDRSYADPFVVVDGERTYVFYERWSTRPGTNGVIEVMDLDGERASRRRGLFSSATTTSLIRSCSGWIRSGG